MADRTSDVINIIPALVNRSGRGRDVMDRARQSTTAVCRVFNWLAHRYYWYCSELVVVVVVVVGVGVGAESRQGI